MSFVFITGAGRSGTTLMRGLLDGHSKLTVYPVEVSSFLEDFLDKSAYAPTITAAQAGGELLEQFVPSDDDTQMRTELKSRLHKAFAKKDRLTAPELLKALSQATLVDVTTSNVEGYLEVFKGAKVIHMIRHPFDTLNSQYRLRFADPNSFGGSHPGNWPLTEAFERVKRSFVEAARFKDDERVHIVRLEDLQDDPEGVMTGVLSFIGLDLEPVNLTQTKGGADYAGNSTQTRTAKVIKQAPDWSCLTDNDLSLASRLPHVGDFYDIAPRGTCANAVGPFLGRAFGFKGENRPKLRSPKKALQLLPIGLSHYLQDLAFKTALEKELAGE